MQKLLLCVEYTAKHGMKEKFVDEVTSSGVLAAIRGEDGCLSYDYYYAVEDEDKILLVEQWASAEKQTIHTQQPHMEQLKALKDKYIADTKFNKSIPIDE